MIKPGDFLLGVMDFFAILLPGAIATWVLATYLPADMQAYVSLGQGGGDVDPVVRGGVFLLAAYTLGHFVFEVGSWLDPSYDRWRKRTKPTESDAMFIAAGRMRKDLMGAHEPASGSASSSGFSTLKWANSYIQIHSPHSRVEIDRLGANSKFFRSLVPVSIGLSAHLALYEHELWLAVAALALGAMSYSRYVDQRWKATQLTYATVVILHATKGEGVRLREDH